ncbi:MAG: hypothetical protein AB1742_00150 [bacterium]
MGRRAPAERVRRVRWAAKAALVAAAVAAAGLLVHFLLFQRQYVFACGACHEMRSHRANLGLAFHGGIACASCHDQSTVFTMLRVKLFDGKRMFSDVRVNNSKCSNCHPRVEDGKVFYRDINFSHGAHLKKGVNCSTCHVSFVHRRSAKTPLLSLRRCRDCHEKERRRHTPPLDVADTGELERQPHGEDWYVEHKHAGDNEKKSCSECHHEDFCVNCHTNYESHLLEWWANHYSDAMIRLAECQICHRPRYCISCHSKAVPASHDDRWEASHWRGVDLSECNECHTLNFCKTCHTRNLPASHKDIREHPGMKPAMEAQCNVCHGANSCSSCHHNPDRRIACLECHDDIMTPTFTTVGGTTRVHDHVKKHGVTCIACHPPSGKPGALETLRNCGDCHHQTTRRRCEDCHRRQYEETDRGSMDFDCALCHKRGRDDFPRPRRVCLSCHALMFEQEAQVHGATSCARCHLPHTWETLPGTSCVKCHEKDVPKHAGKTSGDCAPCHKPHLWKTAERQ